MRANIVLTFSGTDRTGIVEDLTKHLLDLGGNVETSRMARLGGEFAVLMLVSVPEEKLTDLDKKVQGLMGKGFKVTTSPTSRTYAESHAGWLPCQIEILGADHEGIIHEVAQALSKRGINIESMDTETSPAPVTGTPLFSMNALVIIPPDLPFKKLEKALEDAGRRLQVDINITPVKK